MAYTYKTSAENSVRNAISKLTQEKQKIDDLKKMNLENNTAEDKISSIMEAVLTVINKTVDEFNKLTFE